ncbi:MAG: aminoacyl-tRNA hydrolase [Proteobacteria bacterium]|nr:aminoacyl-tRNA hydrolase [Pseudomonadota bacterium]
MKLLVGLGNPGPEYAGNRHNVGFHALDRIAERWRFGPWKKRLGGMTAEGDVVGHRIVALKPLTFMNESGRSVGEASRFLKIVPDGIFVLHDELDLPPAKIRTKTGGGNGGHNGLRSIDAHLGTKDYRRLRIGIGHPGDKDLVSDYVLHDFGKGDRLWLAPLLDAIAESLPTFLDGNEAGFMNKVVRLTAPAEPD